MIGPLEFPGIGRLGERRQVAPAGANVVLKTDGTRFKGHLSSEQSVPQLGWKHEDVVRGCLTAPAGWNADPLENGLRVRQVDDALDRYLDRW